MLLRGEKPTGVIPSGISILQPPADKPKAKKTVRKGVHLSPAENHGFPPGEQSSLAMSTKDPVLAHGEMHVLTATNVATAMAVMPPPIA